MRLPWRPTDPATGRDERETPAIAASSAVQACPSLARALERVRAVEGAQILDLGSGCGATAVFLAQRGGRVSVEEPALGAAPDLRLDAADETFHLVLAWEILDHVPPDRLGEACAELVRVLAVAGWLLFFSLDRPAAADPQHRFPARYRIVEEGKLVREALPGATPPRYFHPTGELERALRPLSVQGIHLLRNQIREVLAYKKP